MTENTELYGPNGDEVAAFIKKAGRLTLDDFIQLDTLRHVIYDDTRCGARRTCAIAAGKARANARNNARDAARKAVWSAACGLNDSHADAFSNFDWVTARDAAADAADALANKDLISKQDFKILYGPWDRVLDEEGESHD